MAATEEIEIEAIMPGATTPEQDQIRGLEFRLEEMKDRLVEELGRAGEGLDSDFLDRFRTTAHEAARLVNESLPLSFPPEAGDEVRRTVLEALTEVEAIDETRPLDAVDRLLLRFEQIRHVIRDACDESVEATRDDGQALARNLLEWLPGVRQAEIAALVETSPRTLQRLAKEGGSPSNRLRLVTRLVALLRRAWTPEGTIAWFHRGRRELDGKAPFDVLGDREFEERLVTMVRQGRAGHGS
jgi:hypothetical protein